PQPAARMRLSRSRARPSALAEGLSTTSKPPSRFQRQIVSPMMSTKVSSFLRLSQTGPSPKMMSRAMMSSGGFLPTSRSPSGVSMSTSIFSSSRDPCTFLLLLRRKGAKPLRVGSHRGSAAVDEQQRARHVGGVVGGQKQDTRRDLIGRAVASEQRALGGVVSILLERPADRLIALLVKGRVDRPGTD